MINNSQKITSDDVIKLISEHEDIVNLGTSKSFVGEDWITKAENKLGLPLTDSYKWFLREYGGGEIGTEEIYSIYGIDFDKVVGGDIVYHYFLNQKNSGILKKNEVEVCATDFGEVFFFDYSQFENNECPIYLRFSDEMKTPYASDFYDFLYKRIIAHLS
jgi:hypothetical protein